MRAAIRGTEIYFDIAGMQLAPAGKHFIERPVLFILHGGPGGDHLRFKQHSLELQDVAQMVFIDNRGCGRSKKTKPSDYTLENNIEDIEALRRHLGLNRICILGTSYGGIVAQGYAVRYPKQVEKLILVATSPCYRFLDLAKKNLLERGNLKQIAISKHLWNGTFKNSKQVMKFFKLMDPLYSTIAKKKHKAIYGKTQTIWSHEALNKGFSGFLRHFDFTSQLKKITSPTLVLTGKDDWICGPTFSKIIAERIPNARLKIFNNCSHAVAVDAHDKYIKIIKNFLQRKKK